MRRFGFGSSPIRRRADAAMRQWINGADAASIPPSTETVPASPTSATRVPGPRATLRLGGHDLEDPQSADISRKQIVVVYRPAVIMTISRKDLMEQDEFWILLFILGGVLLNWPMLSLVGGGETSGPFSILVYIISVWLLIILSAYLFDRWTSN